MKECEVFPRIGGQNIYKAAESIQLGLKQAMITYPPPPNLSLSHFHPPLHIPPSPPRVGQARVQKISESKVGQKSCDIMSLSTPGFLADGFAPFGNK